MRRAKHKNITGGPSTSDRTRHATHGGPVTGTGFPSHKGKKPTGVVFRTADGKAAIPPAAGRASRLRIPRWLGGK